MTKEEVTVINEAIQHILIASTLDPVRLRSPLTMARIFDPGTGLRYFLREVQKDGDSRTLGVRYPFFEISEEKAASQAFTQHIFPTSIQIQLLSLYGQFLTTTGELDCQRVDNIKEKFTVAINDFLYNLSKDLRASFALYYTPVGGTQSVEMADYFLIAILTNVISSHEKLSSEVKKCFTNAYHQYRADSSILNPREGTPSFR